MPLDAAVILPLILFYCLYSFNFLLLSFICIGTEGFNSIFDTLVTADDEIVVSIDAAIFVVVPDSPEPPHWQG